MAREQSTGVIRIWWLPAVPANKAAPTLAEITAGVDLTPYLRRDGFNSPKSGNTADTSDAASRYNKTAPGTYGGDPIAANFYRDSVGGSDLAWNTLIPPSEVTPNGTAGAWLVRRFGGSSVAAASGQRVEVWPAAVISAEMANIAANEAQYFVATCSIPAEPNDRALIA